MRKLTHYMVLQQQTIDTLSWKVNHYIKEDWVPLDGITVFTPANPLQTPSFIQVMVAYRESDTCKHIFQPYPPVSPGAPSSVTGGKCTKCGILTSVVPSPATIVSLPLPCDHIRGVYISHADGNLHIIPQSKRLSYAHDIKSESHFGYCPKCGENLIDETVSKI